MHTWIVVAHVIGAFVFIAAHGTSMVVSFRLRGARDRSTIVELLEVSQQSVGIAYIGLVILLAAGIAGGFTGGYWGRGWIWASIGILVAVMVVMYAVATPFYGRMRAAAGVPQFAERGEQLQPPATPADLEQLATTSRPMWLAAAGSVGLVAIIYLMIVKPF